jgi:glutamyl-tRNA synthetase
MKYNKPIVYKSDRLKLYYRFAEKLIKIGKAYVCHCLQETLRENRSKGIECACRQYPVAMQMKRWKEMFKASEGKATLRIKTNMSDPNPAFRDRVLFKISDREHPRVKHKYRVWPSLEMAFAVDDHELGITHIIRGNDLMIETDMEKYIWDIFKWKHPVTIHSGLIKIEGIESKFSKSKNQKEIRDGTYTGWDDPRTWSIQSLIKRGITKEAIRGFVEEIGLNKQDVTVPIDMLYSLNRSFIDLNTPRYSFVEDPVQLEIKELGVKEIDVPIHPEKAETRKIKVSKIFISKGDFEDHKDEEVRLLHLCNIQLGKVIRVTSYENKKIPKIQWVSDGVNAEILMTDGTYVKGIAEKATTNLKVGTTIQFERFGFVTYQGTQSGKPIFWFAHK